MNTKRGCKHHLQWLFQSFYHKIDSLMGHKIECKILLKQLETHRISKRTKTNTTILRVRNTRIEKPPKASSTLNFWLPSGRLTPLELPSHFFHIVKITLGDVCRQIANVADATKRKPRPVKIAWTECKSSWLGATTWMCKSKNQTSQVRKLRESPHIIQQATNVPWRYNWC